MKQEIADNSRACCNCANGTIMYPNCYCWQHKDCNGDKPYKIPKETWLKTAERCEEFELGTPEEADVYLELHPIMNEESKDKNPKPIKYIDAEKLIAEIERRKYEVFPTNDGKVRACSTPDQLQSGWLNALTWMLRLITSLQQEQPEVQNGKFVFPKYLYARTKDNKTIDMSYAPQDMTAVEYIRNDFIQQEQLKVELEKEAVKFVQSKEFIESKESPVSLTARHFAEWGAIHLNARKEK